MILEPNKNQEIVIGGTKQMMFGIDSDTSIIFDILRNKMYSNKIAAIAREVASNSRDANRESGTNEFIDIEFTIESVWTGGNLSLVFRDRGIGISPERIENIFLKYGASTKRKDNLQTGGFGLGAKTPFAYTDTFVIKTINNSVEYIYSAIIDATGKGKMILISEQYTDQNSGTEIIVPIISSEDKITFEKEIYKATMFWDNVNYINFSTEKPSFNYVIKDSNYTVIENDGWGSYVGLLDGIPYEIRPTGATALPGYTVLLNLKVGEITVSANRESLQYDDKTTKYIDKKYKAFVKSLEQRTTDYLQTNSSYKEAYIKYTYLKQSTYNRKDFGRLISELKHTKSFDFNFDVIFNNEVISYLKFEHHTVDLVKYDLSKDKSIYEGKTLKLDTKIVYLDKGRLSASKNKYLKHFIFIRPKKSSSTEAIEKEVKKLNRLTEKDYQLYSEIVVANTSTYVKREKKDFITFKVRDENNCPIDIMLDIKTCKIKNYDNVLFNPVYTLTGYYSINTDKISVVKFLSPGVKIISINKSSYERHFKNNGFLTFNEYFNKIDWSLFTKIVESRKYNSILEKIPTLVLNDFPHILPKTVRKLLDKCSYTPEILDEVNWSRFSIPVSKINYEKIEEDYKNIMETKYPMLLPYIEGTYDTEEKQLKVVQDYVKRRKIV